LTDPSAASVGARPPTYERDADTQKAFDRAAAILRDRDSWTDDKGMKHLNADLVLEGGGVKGIGFAGAVLALAEAGYHFKRVAGTSAGAIAATLVAAIEKAGKDMSVISDYLGQLQFDSFLREGRLRHLAGKMHLATVADAATLMTQMGLYSGDYLAEWLTPILKGLGVATFADLRITDDPGMSLPEDHQYTLVVHASDISRLPAGWRRSPPPSPTAAAEPAAYSGVWVTASTLLPSGSRTIAASKKARTAARLVATKATCIGLLFHIGLDWLTLLA
jgi:predicted acylesterase/phospholipase RssA